jgi:hypothetical protein
VKFANEDTKASVQSLPAHEQRPNPYYCPELAEYMRVC